MKNFLIIFFSAFSIAAFTQSGNVGIGNTSPSEKLHLTGNLLIRNAQNNGAIIISPSAYGYGINPELYLQSSETATGNNAAFHISRNAKYNGAGYSYIDNSIVAQGITFDGAGHILFKSADAGQTGNIAWTTNMVIRQNGNVGVGATNPSQKLTVVGGHVQVSQDYGFTKGWGSNSEFGYLPHATGINALGGIGVNAPHNNGTLVYSDALIAFVESDADKVSGWMNLNNNQFIWNGLISSSRIKVQTNVWADYVFDTNYQLKSLDEVQQFINQNGHLPNVPSQKEIVKNGFDISDMTVIQQEKIEELFLHTINLQNQVKELQNEIEKLKTEK